ncbi:M81 family metallopeptidase [Termitidicoccus mucosus]|uniref:Microcystin degradation protein MlrC n=1 Tax=Termitidicoccus mucosus TaxID=1184151 RepID=A0A178IDW9_9BACT|nr:hypothetical protein AW736_18465 [Opitutaceae bacterium TSB47]
MKRPRILYAGLFHETNSFVDQPTHWGDFNVSRGAAILAKEGDASVTDGFLTEARKAFFDVIPTIDAWALPGGTVRDTAFENFWNEFETAARPALADGVDGIFLVLHGAMATESHADAEGEFLRRLRTLPGAASTPVFGVLDLHANVTEAMCRHANALVCYRENPHIDACETGRRATALLRRCIDEGRVPHMAWCHPPMMWAPPATGTGDEPMRALTQFARAIETANPSVWTCNIAAGFSFADTPDTGVSVSIITTGPRDAGCNLAAEGARLAWTLREKGRIAYPDVDTLIADIVRNPPIPGEKPVLLVDPSDNIGGGAPGDCTGVMRALLRHRVPRALVVINDPLSVRALSETSPGDISTLEIGGRGSRFDEGPVKLEATLVSRGDGRFALEDKQSHLAAMSGSQFDMGPCAVVKSGGLTLLLTSRKTPPFDLGQLRSQGLEPLDFAFIGVKAAVAHRRAYDKISSRSLYVDAPGPCTCDLARLPWRRLHRPCWPIDPSAQFPI